MKAFTNIKILLVFIIALAAFLRFFQLGNNPPSLTWDEAAWGYNAYTLGIDGHDEFGRFLPYDYLESFGDFKPPMYAYLDIIPVRMFGLTPFAARVPSAFFGTVTVLITYFLVRQLFGNRGTLRNKTQKNYLEYIALLSALIVAISPWHIMLSRAAFEANIATFFLITGVWLFLKGIQEKDWYLPLSIIAFIASVYTFNSARVVAPLLLVGLSVGFRKVLWQKKNNTLISLIVGIILILPIIHFLLSPQASLRFKEVNIFSDINVIKTANQEIANDRYTILSKLIHNRRVAYSLAFLHHYFDNLEPAFLFLKGDGNPKFSTQDVGEMYLWDLPFFIAGIFLLVRKREGNWWIISLWLLSGIIPAATARETPHALRIEATLPTFQILTAYGFVNLVCSMGYLVYSIKIRRIAIVVIFVLLFLSILYFQHGYYAHYPEEYSSEWQYGYQESVAYAARTKDQFQQVYITNSLGRPYIYYLFYTKTDPNIFRKTAIIHRDAFGFVDVLGFDKYHFPKLITSARQPQTTLYINAADQVPVEAHILKTFYLINHKPVLTAYTL